MTWLAWPCASCGHARAWHQAWTACSYDRCGCAGYHRAAPQIAAVLRHELGQEVIMTDGTTVAFSEELDPEALEAVVQQMWELMQDTQDMRDRDEL